MRKTAAIVGINTEHSVRTAVEAYDAGAFDNLVCEDEKPLFIIDDLHLRDYLDDAEEEIVNLQKRVDELEKENQALKKTYDIIEKTMYTVGYIRGQSGHDMDEKYK